MPAGESAPIVTAGTNILQIVPHLPGTFDGVGDYALTLAKVLFDEHDIRTCFLVANPTAVENKDGFEIISALPADLSRVGAVDHVILHYANYGYEARGTPFELRNFAQRLRKSLRGRWLTMFHELYASGPPWRSAFWTRPFQVEIARHIIDLSDVCVVSNQVVADEIHRHDGMKAVRQVPVMSNFGEPHLTDFSQRSPRRWAICGGAGLLAQSLRSFVSVMGAIPDPFRPEQLDLVGGRRDPGIRASLKTMRDLTVNYHPEISAEAASEILERCAFGWIDYFGRGKVWPDMIFKSGSLAAYCAHGTVPIVAHRAEPLTLDGDTLAGPFLINGSDVRFPPSDRVPQTAAAIYAWYHRHASSERTAEVYAQALQ